MNDTKDNGGSVYPNDGYGLFEPDPGMTLRDYFAAKVLSGLCASRRGDYPKFEPRHDAQYCYAVADAMLKARKEGK